MSIPRQFVQELLARADIVELVGRYVQLKKTGANFSGLCPFHSEKSPSFTVSPSKQFYHCFGCGKSGDAIRFLMEHTGTDFADAVHDLAQQYGLQVPEEQRSPLEREHQAQESRKRATLTDVLARAAEAWRKQLKASPHAIGYLKQRGLSGQAVHDFGLGYAPEGWHSLASVFADYADPLLVDSGLVIVSEDGKDREQRRYDRFRDRIMFPIRSVKGDVIGFGGRVLGDEKPKYLNSPETPVFHKGRELYGLFEARAGLREHGYALVTEGYMDVVALAQLGFANAVATLGTACTPEHVQKLFRFTDQVVFSFDGDAAGRRAARKALQAALPLATDVRSIKFLFLPPEHDPDSFIRTEGSDAFADAVKAAVPLSRFLLDAAGQECDPTSAEGRARFAANARALWQLLPVGALAAQLLGEIAAKVQIGTHELEQLWGLNRSAAAHRDDEKKWPRHREGASGAKHTPPAQQRIASPPAIHPRTSPTSRASRALQILLTDPGAWERLSEANHALLCDLPPPYGPLFTWLAGQSLDHGPQPWSALRQGLHGHEHEAFAVEQVMRVPPDIAAEPAELEDILRGEQREHLKRRMDKALAAGDMPQYQVLLGELSNVYSDDRDRRLR
ncbi:MAG: DNA primase [Burkholderiaceae bacterium]|nr:DNA primase [Burkholderiaceae bacterium]